MGSSSRIAGAAPMFFVALWATGFVGAKFGLPYADPLTFLSIRFGIAAVLLGLWAAWAGEWRGWAGGGGRRALGAVIVGVLIHGVYLGGVFTAISIGVGAAMSALIVGLQPIATALMAGAMLGERLRAQQWGGMALGLCGVILVFARKFDAGEIGFAGAALCVAGLISISYATILQKRRAVTAHLAADGAVQFAAASAAMALCAAIFEERRVEWTAEFVMALSWMTIVLSLGAISLLYAMLRRGEASKTASLFFLVPGVTALMAWAMFGETFGVIEIAGLAAATLGVRLVVQAPGRGAFSNASR